MLLLDAIIAPTMRTVSVQVTISSSFPKMLIEGIVCALIKRRREHDGFVVSTTTVPCHEHFEVEDITKNISGRWHLRNGCEIFQLLLCLCYVYMTTVQCAFLLLAISNFKSPRYFGLY